MSGAVDPLAAQVAELRKAAQAAGTSMLIPPNAVKLMQTAAAVVDGLHRRLTELDAMLSAPCGECRELASQVQELREQHRAPCEGCGTAGEG